MKTYAEMVAEYRKRQRDTVVDTLATGLTYMDEIAVDTGLLEETGLMTGLADTLTGILPFAIITISEGAKIILKRKPGKTGVKDGACRMAKTGVAMGVGAAVAGAAGFWAAIPATMGVRALFDRYRSRALTGRRIQGRINRLKELNAFIRREEAAPEASAETDPAAFAAEGSVY